MNIARSSIRVFVARASSSFITFLGLAYFARELGSHEMGVFFLFQALLGMIAVPADFGIGSGVTKRLSEGESTGSILSTAIVLKLLLLLPFIAGIVLFQDPINNYLGADLALLLIFALILQEAANLAMKVLKGELRVGETSGPVFARKFVYIGSGAILVTLGSGVEGLIYGLFAGTFTMLFLGLWKSSTTPSTPSFKHARSLFDYSKYAFISSIGGYFYSWMDVAIIGLFLSQSEVGIYEIAWRITAVVMLFSSSLATSIFPQISRWHTEDAIERISSMLSEAVPLSLFIAIPSFFGTALFSREILGLVFGNEYIGGWLVLIILMGEKTIQSVQAILGRSLQSINQPNLAARASIVAIFSNIVLNIILVSVYGIVGAAIATTISFGVNSILHYYYLSKFIQLEISNGQIAGCLVSGLGMYISLMFIKSQLGVDSVLALLLYVFGGAILYIGFSLLVPQSRNMLVNNLKRVTKGPS